MNVAEQIGEICALEGVRLIAGIMGGSATHIVRALDAIPGRKALYCRQERVAVDACDGFARVTGEPAVVFTDAGPGAANAMCGIINSWGDSVPVLFFAPIQDRFEVFAQRFTKELPIEALYGPVSKWTAKLVDPGQVDRVMRTAFTMLRAPRSGPVVIGIPRDLARMPALPLEHVRMGRTPRLGADPAQVAEALQLLAAAEHPYLYAGVGVLNSGGASELRELAELLSLPVATTLNAKGVFPENHRLSLGLGGFPKATYSTLQAETFMAEADVVLAIGCGYKRDAVKARMRPETKVIQVDVDPGALNHTFQASQAVLGDAKVFLGQLLELARALPAARLAPRADVPERIAELKARWLEVARPFMESTERPINPYRVTAEFGRLVDHDQTIVLHDAGGTRGYISQHYEANKPGSFIGYGVQSAMGWSLGAAMGAKVAAPDKLVTAFIGDEAFLEVALDLETSVVCDAPILVVLFNNREHSLSQLATMSGGRGFNPTLGPVRWRGSANLSQLALSLGCASERVEDPEDIRPALERAIATVNGGQTCVVEFVTSRAPHMLGPLWREVGAAKEQD